MILTLGENVKELVMMELQGEVHYYDSLDGVRLGKLEKDGQKCKFVIGNHILRGKIEKLSKPLTLVEKKSGNLEICGMITQKIIFSERPTPIPMHTKQTIKTLAGR
jgi:hypothetical protein